MMASGITFKVEGLKELDAKLGELTQAAGKGVLRRVGRHALEPFDAAWRDLAPVLTGGLKESGGIGSKLTRRQRKANVRDSTVEVFAGPGPHAKAVQDEFGNSHQAAQPYVRPAWAATKDMALEIVKDDLATEIIKTSARARKAALRKAALAAADEG